jgi:hypothetical protein
MTIDEIIGMLESAKKELGGDKEISIHLETAGKGDFVDIESLTYSNWCGLHFEVSPPWWVYEKQKI